MPDRALFVAGLAGAVAAAICCAAPMLAVNLGTAGLMASLAAGAYAVIPALLVCLGLVAYRLNRRRNDGLPHVRTERLGNQVMSSCCAKLGADPTLQGNLMELRSTLSCPHCGHQETETMPTDACQFFYGCKGCGVVLRPNVGDCCVFCSYGSVPCPPVQEARENGSAGNCCARPVVG